MRFPFFNNKWSTTTLGTITKVFSGGTPSSKNKAYYNGNIPFIRSGEINKEETELFLSEDGLKNSSAKLVSKGDLLLALYGATSGEIGISKIDGAINQAILCIKSNENIGFLKYLWESHVDGILKTYLQGGQGNLSAEIFKSIKIHIPSLEEQLVLYDFFEKLEKRINTQKKIINKIKSLIISIKNTEFYNTKGFKEKLENILIEINEKTIINDQHEVLSSTVKGIFKQSDYFDRAVASENNIGYKIVKRGNIVVSPQNLWMGNISYNDKFDIGIVSPSYKIFNISSNYNERYIFEMLTTKKSLYLFKTVSEQGASVVRRNLNYEAFMQLTFNIPSLNEQNNFIEKLSLLQNKLSLENKILSLLEQQKQYLLDKLFI